MSPRASDRNKVIVYAEALDFSASGLADGVCWLERRVYANTGGAAFTLTQTDTYSTDRAPARS